jgi:membrane protease subunit HflK
MDQQQGPGMRHRMAGPETASAAQARLTALKAELKITAAQEHRDRALAEARGQSREIGDKAAAERDRLVLVARGEADRFTKVLAQAEKAPEATQRRLYLEALGELLPRFTRKVVVEQSSGLDVGLFADEGQEGPP